VRVSDETTGEIGPGLLVLVGVTHSDTDAEARRLASKLWGLRIFDAGHNGATLSVGDVGGELLVVSQFTLYGDTSRGRRPSWSAAAPAAHAEPLVNELVAALGDLGAQVAVGRFGAHMQVTLENDGPVTLVVDA
jgi:D-tyrosyl-tRNA(Tyr) deacylase